METLLPTNKTLLNSGSYYYMLLPWSDLLTKNEIIQYNSSSSSEKLDLAITAGYSQHLKRLNEQTWFIGSCFTMQNKQMDHFVISCMHHLLLLCVKSSLYTLTWQLAPRLTLGSQGLAHLSPTPAAMDPPVHKSPLDLAGRSRAASWQ